MLPELLDRVATGEEITILRHGKPVATLIAPDRLRARRLADVHADADRIGKMMADARQRPLPEPSLSVERAEELLSYVRESRER